MLALTILSVFVLLVIGIIVFEVRNERKYQAKRREKRNNHKNNNTKNLPKAPPSPPIDKYDSKPEVEKEPKEEEKKLPKCTYPTFSHIRLIEMGLTEEEAKEFVQELIPQLETQITLIEEVLSTSDFNQMERLTHDLKGSTTNLGVGGIADLLVEYNTYLKTGTDVDIVTAYFGYLKHYTQELKEQYS